MTNKQTSTSIQKPLAILFLLLVTIGTAFACYRWLDTAGPQEEASGHKAQTVQAFVFGAESVGKIDRKALAGHCQSTGTEFSLFCYEGYFFGELLARKSISKMTTTEFDLQQFASLSPTFPEFVRAIWMTSLGLALAEKNVKPSDVTALSEEPLVAQVIDGWGFRKYQTSGGTQAIGLCESFDGSEKNACEFGMGRASFFRPVSTPPTPDAKPFFKEGYYFASTYTALPNAAAMLTQLPAEKGGKAAFLVKQIWFRNPAYLDQYKSFYDCTSRAYLADCLDRID